MKKKIRQTGSRRRLWIVCAVFIVLLAAADRQGWLLASDKNDFDTYDGVQTVVMRIVDGDTIDIAIADAQYKGDTTRVRLLGVDCPEVARSEKLAEAWADQATELTRSLAVESTITLHLERDETRGKYGRLLAHIELPDGSCLNEQLLLHGLARAEERWPHSRLKRYAEAERRAKHRGNGIWSDPSEG